MRVLKADKQGEKDLKEKLKQWEQLLLRVRLGQGNEDDYNILKNRIAGRITQDERFSGSLFLVHRNMERIIFNLRAAVSLGYYY